MNTLSLTSIMNRAEAGGRFHNATTTKLAEDLVFAARDSIS
jgi:hypothetical protein